MEFDEKLDDQKLRAVTLLDLDDDRQRGVLQEMLPLIIDRLRTLAADRLLSYIGELSEKYTKNSWSPGIEVSIWRSIQEGPETAEEEEINLAEQLSEEAGGWWWRPDATPAIFLPLGAWREKYQELSRESENLHVENLRLKRTIENLRREIARGETE
jgi:hypothetical protein